MGYQIRWVSTEREMEAVARLRYEIYSEEEGHAIAGMHRGARTLVDDIDRDSAILGVFDGELAIATLRLTPLPALGVDDPLRSIHAFEAFHFPESQKYLLQRFMLKPELRGSLLYGRMLASMEAFCVSRGIAALFYESSPRTVAVYEATGGHPYRPAFGDPQFGLCVPMVTLMSDASCAGARPASRTTSAADRAATSLQGSPPLSESALPLSSPLSLRQLPPRTRGAVLQSLVDSGDGLFGDLALADLDRLLRHALILTVPADVAVIPRHTRSNELLVILDGAIAHCTDGPAASARARTLRPGDALGAGSFLHGAQSPLLTEFRSVTAVRLLVVTAEDFSAVRRSQPAVAQAFLRSLRRRLGDRWHFEVEPQKTPSLARGPSHLATPRVLIFGDHAVSHNQQGGRHV